MKRKLKIAQISPAFYPFIGGIEKATFETSKRLVERGHQVTVYTSCLNSRMIKEKLKERENILGIEIRRFKNIGGILGTWLPKIEEDGDIIHLRNYCIWPHSYLIQKYYGKKPLLCTFHGGFSRFEGDFPFSFNIIDSAKFFWQYLVGKPNLSRLSRIIALHEWEKQNLVLKGAPEKSVVVIPNGIEEEAFKKYAPKKFDMPYFLSLCRVSPVKNLDHVIKVLPNIKKIYFVIAGVDSEGEQGRLIETAKKLGVLKRVKFVGAVSGPEKYSYISGARAVIVPSKWEMLSHTILETMAQGKIVIASNSYGNPYIVNNEVDGLIYPFGHLDKLSSLMERVLKKDEKSLRKVKISARKKLKENYRWDTIVDRIEELYFSLVDK